MSDTARTAIVTGGSRGIGAAICRQLARDGHVVHLVFRAAVTAAKQVAEDITADGGDVVVHQADISQETDVAHLIARVRAAPAGSTSSSTTLA